MALTIYMDVYIPAAITDGPRRIGLDVLTSQKTKRARPTMTIFCSGRRRSDGCFSLTTRTFSPSRRLGKARPGTFLAFSSPPKRE